MIRGEEMVATSGLEREMPLEPLLLQQAISVLCEALALATQGVPGVEGENDPETISE